jgi:hypothetical protein
MQHPYLPPQGEYLDDLTRLVITRATETMKGAQKILPQLERSAAALRTISAAESQAVATFSEMRVRNRPHAALGAGVPSVRF